MKRALTLLAAATALTAVAVTGAYALSSHETKPVSVAPSVGGLENVNFVSLCRFSRRLPDDPIVHPGQPGVSHDHTFFGNTTTDAFSTPAGLVGKPSTCDPTTDTASYWAPSLV